MSARIGLLSTLAIGCLLVGCTTTPTVTDAGPTVDAGPKDAGPKDAGQQSTGGEIGENCINNNAGQLEQSTCADGLVCLPLSQENTTLTVCTKDCTANADCGVGTNGAANFCWSGICWQGCSGDTCNQGDFSCQQGFVQNTGLCLPDCEQQAKSFCSEFFGYPFNVCDTGTSMAQGSCGTAGDNASCGPTMACTGSNEACYAIPPRNGSTTSPGSVCVDDCTAIAAGAGPACRNNTECESDNCVSGHCAPCGAGANCDATLKTCQVTPVADYGFCNPGLNGACQGTSTCINFGNGQGACLPACTTDAMCPAAGTGTTPKCALELTNGSKVCALDCSASGSVCPTDTACAQIQGLGSFCFPSN